MNLRSDPTANAVMAGAFTKANAGKLADRLGRKPTEGELYIAHFLGPTGASRLIGAGRQPARDAAPPTLFPSAARANPTIFYDGSGNARSAGEVYRALVGRYDVARGGAGATPAPPSRSRRRRRAVRAQRTGVRARHRAASPRPMPRRRACRRRAAGCRHRPGVPRPVPHQRRPRAGGAGGQRAVERADRQRRDAARPPAAPAAAAPTPLRAARATASGSTLDLFQDQLPDARALFRGRV